MRAEPALSELGQVHSKISLISIFGVHQCFPKIYLQCPACRHILEACEYKSVGYSSLWNNDTCKHLSAAGMGPLAAAIGSDHDVRSAGEKDTRGTEPSSDHVDHMSCILEVRAYALDLLPYPTLMLRES